MFPTDFLIFLQIILFLFITPGPPRVVIVSHTLNYGIKKSIWTAFGDISANLCQGILVVFFIGTFLSDNPDILKMLKWAGIAYGLDIAGSNFAYDLKTNEFGALEDFTLEDLDGNLIFTGMGAADPFSTSPIFNVSVEQMVGWLHIFPSTLGHSVYPFRGKGERRSLSFNADMTPIAQN